MTRWITDAAARAHSSTFHRRARKDEVDTDAYTYIEDGAHPDPQTARSWPRAPLPRCRPRQAPLAPRSVDHRPHLLMAGFIDTHVHFPQVQVIASWGSQLLDWLNNYTFPEETRFADAEPQRRDGGGISMIC